MLTISSIYYNVKKEWKYKSFNLNEVIERINQ